MKRITVRADEVKVGDRIPGGGDRVEAVEWSELSEDGRRLAPHRRPVLVWIEGADYDGMGQPSLTFAPSDPVEVWREVGVWR